MSFPSDDPKENESPADEQKSAAVGKPKGRHGTEYVNTEVNSTKVQSFVGRDSGYGIVIGLRGEKCDVKASFDKFRKNMAIYYSSQCKVQHAQDTVAFVRDMVDPYSDFEKTNKPNELTATEFADKMKS